jgi:hypothetical protein
VRFDSVEGLQLRVNASRHAPLDVPSLLSKACVPPRTLRAHEPPLLVRTIGPDAHYIGVVLDPRKATVGELRAALAQELGTWAPEQVELRATWYAPLQSSARHPPRVAFTCSAAHCSLPGDVSDEQRLHLLGVADAWRSTGTQLIEIQAHLPMLIS